MSTPLDPSFEPMCRTVARRFFLTQCALGVGSMALHALVARDSHAGYAVKIDPTNPLDARTPPLSAKAKRIIYLFMAGGPSQLELFDDKPRLRVCLMVS